MKNFIFLSIISIISSCTKDNPEPTSRNLDNSVIIYLNSSEGNNLLNTINYNSNNYRIYYKNGNEYIEQNNSNLDYPKNFFINSETNPISMKLFLNHLSTETNPITVVKWNDTESDTLKTFFRRGTDNNTDYEICEKIWLNDALIWDINNNQNSRQITIIK
ncbi:hypothetical protein [Flavobacterium psychrophilum]|uniref:hypothetical protein n=1 Tax=Flavobacterium psychrophilum TaxID=96345 RepID=UPI000B7C270E|nr:hypothetical protein [Flavobacterium psychrophilum]EKT4502358.1 hypothetical protein [Flavobacterium psychrophilum]MBF2024822.1 hypothetical protein [Flavobacterium psychrophilum]MCB5983155.1 hypothetical protein [Flavobacterium psychrophilum]MCB5995472.1 hypothetical protein [Flavobacterium psychrophilum]MCB5997739.1 hypothetical protein [Flavobacterium psychrophilum]